MNVNELRIGNWVSTKGYPDNVIVVHSISKDYVNESRFEHQTNNLHHNVIKPIPITEEHLLNFGFTKDSSFHSQSNIKYEFTKKIKNNLWLILVQSDGYYSVGIDSEEYASVNNIEYVHELQNLWYVLAKEEL